MPYRLYYSARDLYFLPLIVLFTFLMNTLIVISSTRPESVSASAAFLTTEYLNKYGTDTHVLDLRQTPLPLFSEDNRTLDEYATILALVHNADCYILSTPDFHGSMSGILKNFLDYFWTEFAGKLFGIICASHDKGLTAMDHIRTVIRQCYGWSLPYGIGLSENDLDRYGTLHNPYLNKRLQMFARDMYMYGKLISRQRLEDLGGADEMTYMARYREH